MKKKYTPTKKRYVVDMQPLGYGMRPTTWAGDPAWTDGHLVMRQNILAAPNPRGSVVRMDFPVEPKAIQAALQHAARRDHVTGKTNTRQKGRVVEPVESVTWADPENPKLTKPLVLFSDGSCADDRYVVLIRKVFPTAQIVSQGDLLWWKSGRKVVAALMKCLTPEELMAQRKKEEARARKEIRRIQKGG